MKYTIFLTHKKLIRGSVLAVNTKKITAGYWRVEALTGA